MQGQKQHTIHQRLEELTKLYYSGSNADYEIALQAAINQLQQVLPDFTIALAEIYTIGTNRQTIYGMRHVIMPTERSK